MSETLTHAGRISAGPQFDRREEYAYGLPGYFYYADDILALEKDRVFLDSWLLVGYDHQLREPGDYVTATLFDQPVMVVRQGDGTLKGFYNTCQHRGHILLEGHGNVKRIRCPFHSWNYELDGRLRWAPNAERVPNFCAENHSLAEIRTEVFARMVFVTLNPTLPPLAEQVNGLESQMREVIPGLEGLYHARRDVLDIPANWKLIFDGLECYHCPFIHPGVMNSDDDYMTRDIRSIEYSRFQHHVFRGNRDVIDGVGGQPRPAWAENLDSYDLNLWYLWPNIMLMSHPGRANLKVAHAWPVSPGKTIRIIDHFLTTPEPTALDLAQIEQHAGVFRQDIAAMAATQTGVQARGYKQSRLMIDPEHSWQSEHATHHFQKLVWDAVTGS